MPIGIAALFVVSATLNLPHFRRDHRIDWWGAAFLTIALVPLLTVAEQGRTWGWGSGRSLACYVVGVLGVAAFVFAEWRIGDEALIPLRLSGTGRSAWPWSPASSPARACSAP